MKFVIQRVTEASCTVDGNVTGAIQKGFLVLIGIADTDTRTEKQIYRWRTSAEVFC